MNAPTVKSVKVYAVVESTLELPCLNLEAFLREQHFSGNVVIVYNQGGIRSMTTQEHIPVTMANLDRLLAMNDRNGSK